MSIATNAIQIALLADQTTARQKHEEVDGEAMLGIRDRGQRPTVVNNEKAEPVRLARTELVNRLGDDVFNVVVTCPHERPAVIRDFMRAL